MYTTLERFFTLVSLALGIGGIALRLSFQVGCLLTEFQEHVKNSDKTHNDMDADIRELRTRRR